MTAVTGMDIWDECGCSKSDYVKVHRVLPSLALAQLRSGDYALIELDSGDELGAHIYTFPTPPEVEPVDDDLDHENVIDSWGQWFDVSEPMMNALGCSFNLDTSFHVIRDSSAAGFAMEEHITFWLFNRIATVAALMESDPIREKFLPIDPAGSLVEDQSTSPLSTVS